MDYKPETTDLKPNEFIQKEITPKISHIRTESILNTKHIFDRIHGNFELKNYTKSAELLQKFANAMRNNLAYDESFVTFNIPQILYQFAQNDKEEKLRHVALYTISQLLRTETKEYLHSLEPDKVKESIVYCLQYIHPDTCNSVFYCLIGLLEELPDETKGIFMSIDESYFVQSITTIQEGPKVINFGFMFLKHILKKYLSDEMITERIMSITFKAMQEMDHKSESMTNAIAIYTIVQVMNDEQFQKFNNESHLCDYLNTQIKTFDYELISDIMVLISNASVLNSDIDYEFFIDMIKIHQETPESKLTDNDDDNYEIEKYTRTRVKALFAIGRIILHHQEYVAAFAPYKIIEYLISTLECETSEKKEKVFILGSYAVYGTSDQKQYLLDNEFLQSLVDFSDDNDLFDLVVFGVTSLIDFIKDTQGFQVAMDVLNENDIPELIDRAMCCDDQEVVERATSFYQEFNSEE